MGVFLAVVLGAGGYIVYWYQNGLLDDRARMLEAKRSELVELAETTSVYGNVWDALRELERKWESQQKIIPTEESPALTVAYLNNILATSGAFMEYDFTFDEIEKRPAYSTSLYTLVGRGSFQSLYKFTWYLENGRRLVKIESLSLRAVQEAESEGAAAKVLLEFAMKLRTYSAPETSKERRVLAAVGGSPGSFRDPFHPLVWDEVPANSEGLLDVGSATLVALTSEEAFVVDEQTGTTRILREGDKVYLGYLYRIVPGRNRAIFKLDKAGVGETVVLTLGEGQESTALPAAETWQPTPEPERETTAPRAGVDLLGAEVNSVASGTEVVLRLSGPCEFRAEALSAPNRIVVDLEPASLAWPRRRIDANRGPIGAVRVSQFSMTPLVVRAVIDLRQRAGYEVVRRGSDVVVIVR